MSKVRYVITAVAALSVLAVSAGFWYTSRETLPRQIRIAAGKEGGLYHTFARDFAKRLQQRTGRPVRVLETAGSEANVALLRNGEAELALVQTMSLTPEGVAGVAPLFPEPLHFIARKGTKIGSPADLAGMRVAIGLRGSSIRHNAQTVLAHYGIPLDRIHDAEDPFGALAASDRVDAVLVTTGWMIPALEKLLNSEKVELIGLADPEGLATRHPWFVPTTIPRGLYGGKPPVPGNPVPTVAVTALLTVSRDASEDLVAESLAALYETDLRASYPGVLSAKVAKNYDAAVMHPGVATYHDPSARFNQLSRAMELVSNSKEALFGVAAFAVLAWSWLRRRRERIAEAGDRCNDRSSTSSSGGR